MYHAKHFILASVIPVLILSVGASDLEVLSLGFRDFTIHKQSLLKSCFCRSRKDDDY
jgi:hypothetical protein